MPALACDGNGFPHGQQVGVTGQAPGDEVLVARSQAGSTEAFEVLVERYTPRLHHFLFRLVGQSQDAEDLTQVALVKAWRNIGAYEATGSFSSWLYTIARRTAYNHHRSFVALDPLPEESGGAEAGVEWVDPSATLAGKDDMGAVWALSRQLKPHQHEALWLRYGEGFSVAEVARILGYSSLRTKVLLHRARAALARLIESRNSRLGFRVGIRRSPREDGLSDDAN